MISLNPSFTTSANRDVTLIIYKCPYPQKDSAKCKIMVYVHFNFLQKQYPLFTLAANTAKIN